MGSISNATAGLESKTGTYTGNDGVSRAIPHTLGRIPVLVIITRDSSGLMGIIRHSSGFLTGRAAEYAVTAADATNFYVGNAGSFPNSMNGNAVPYTWHAIG